MVVSVEGDVAAISALIIFQQRRSQPSLQQHPLSPSRYEVLGVIQLLKYIQKTICYFPILNHFPLFSHFFFLIFLFLIIFPFTDNDNHVSPIFAKRFPVIYDTQLFPPVNLWVTPKLFFFKDNSQISLNEEHYMNTRENCKIFKSKRTRPI